MTRFSPQRVKQARLEAGLTQSQLARYCETPEQNIGRWERGANTPYGHNLGMLAKVLGKPLDFFYVEDLTEAELEAEAIAKRALAS